MLQLVYYSDVFHANPRRITHKLQHISMDNNMVCAFIKTLCILIDLNYSVYFGTNVMLPLEK